jgi:methylated-DNA-[protein]-cysteine S-methyltransferase
MQRSASSSGGASGGPAGGIPSAFARRVLSAVRRIPHGAVATYGDIAGLAGSPGAARAVGSVMRNCKDPFTPCHRVIAAGGALGGFGSWPGVKRQRLAAEGRAVTATRVKRFEAVRWRPFGRRRATNGPKGPV